MRRLLLLDARNGVFFFSFSYWRGIVAVAVQKLWLNQSETRYRVEPRATHLSCPASDVVCMYVTRSSRQQDSKSVPVAQVSSHFNLLSSSTTFSPPLLPLLPAPFYPLFIHLLLFPSLLLLLLANNLSRISPGIELGRSYISISISISTILL